MFCWSSSSNNNKRVSTANTLTFSVFSVPIHFSSVGDEMRKSIAMWWNYVVALCYRLLWWWTSMTNWSSMRRHCLQSVSIFYTCSCPDGFESIQYHFPFDVISYKCTMNWNQYCWINIKWNYDVMAFFDEGYNHWIYISLSSIYLSTYLQI